MILFFLYVFFGVFHLHRIWALVERSSYAKFWLSVLQSRGIIYFILLAIMMLLCLGGFIAFVRNRRYNFWWRYLYLLGGAYVVFDLFAIYFELPVWKEVIYTMFDTSNSNWTLIWGGGFIGMGALSLVLGIRLIMTYMGQRNIRMKTRRRGRNR